MQMTVKSESPQIMTDTFIKISRISTYILFFILGGFILVGRQFIHLWVGDTFNEAYLFTVLIMIGLTFTLSQSFGNDLLQAKNKHRFRGIVILTATILGVAVGWYLSLSYGAIGLISSIVAFIFLERIVMWWYMNKELHINMINYFKDFSGQLVCFLIALLISYPLLGLISTTGWFGLLTKIILFSAMYSCCMYQVMNTTEKRLVYDLIPATLKIKR